MQGTPVESATPAGVFRLDGMIQTVLHGAKSMRGSSLTNSIFDIHYNIREAGGCVAGAEKIRYALIITVEVDLYNEILRVYTKMQVSLPISV